MERDGRFPFFGGKALLRGWREISPAFSIRLYNRPRTDVSWTSEHLSFFLALNYLSTGRLLFYTPSAFHLVSGLSGLVGGS